MSITVTRAPKIVSAARNPVGIQVEPDPAWSGFDSYYLKLVFTYELDYKSGTFITSPADIRGYPDQNDLIEFNIKRLLESIVGSDRPNLISSDNAVINTEMNKRYRIYIEEYQDGVLANTWDSGILHVLNAGFGDDKGQYLYSWVGSLQFLTHQPRIKRITPAQHEYLSYFLFSAGTISVKMDIFFDDDTQILNYDPGISIVGDDYDVLTFAVSFERLNLIYQTKVVESYEIWLESSNASKPISERMRYEMDDLCTPLDRYYLFENSLGGYDCLRTTGEMEMSLETSGQTVEKILSPFASTSTRKIYDVNTYSQNTYKQYTGYITFDESIWISDIYRSKDAYRIGGIKPNMDATGNLVPIRIPPGSNEITKDNAFMEGMIFNYQEGYRNQGL